LRVNPADQQANAILGVAEGSSGNARAAVAAFDKAGTIAAEYRPTAVKAYGSYATAQLDAKKFADAVKYASRALDMDAQNLQGFYVRGIAYANIGNDAASIDDLSKARAIAAAANVDARTMATIGFNLAVTQLDAGRLSDAAATAKDVSALDPARGPQLEKFAFAAIDNAAIALANQDNIEEAVNRLEVGARAFPGSAAALLAQAAYVLAAEKKPDWERVKSEADKSLAIDPRDGHGNYIRGFAALQQGDGRLALAFINKAKTSPSYASDAALGKQIDDALKSLNAAGK
jgi:tetratricopeptide (TPR) repeat protein